MDVLAHASLAYSGNRMLRHCPVRLVASRSLSIMARKSARAIAARAPSSSPQPQDQQSRELTTGEPLSLPALKTCLTCGRMITPRAKWSKNWTAIKYCSDRCRSSRPGKLVVSIPSSLNSEWQQAPRAQFIEQIANIKGTTEISGDGGAVVDIEALVEAVLLSTAAESSQRGARGATLEDAETRLRDLVPASADDLSLVWRAIDSPPGLRERVRRAARRLALGITHDSSTEQALIIDTKAGHLQLYQNGMLLTTVEQLSFAKGSIHMRLRSDTT